MIGLWGLRPKIPSIPDLWLISRSQSIEIAYHLSALDLDEISEAAHSKNTLDRLPSPHFREDRVRTI